MIAQILKLTSECSKDRVHCVRKIARYIGYIDLFCSTCDRVVKLANVQ